MVKTLFTAIVALGLSLAVYLFFYLGFYKPVDVSVAKRGPLHLLYKPHAGAYHTIGTDIAEVETWAKERQLDCQTTFGEYIDDPDAVDQDRLRSLAGCVLREPLPQAVDRGTYLYQERAPREYVVATFTGSPSIGPFKVYPRAKKFIAEKKLKVEVPVIETYLINGSAVTTEVLFAIDESPAAPAPPAN